MAHRSDRDRDRDDRRDRDRERRRGDERDPRREPIREREPARPSRGGGEGLNEFFIDGEGIHREVMQREICKYLGPEAFSRPGAYNGRNGFIVKAVRPFTPKMLEDLKDLSEDYIRENREVTRRGYPGIPYGESQTSRRQDAALQDPYAAERQYAPQPAYTLAPTQGGYPSTSNGYPDPSRYPPQALGYPQGSGYPAVSGYPPGYPQGAGYPSPSAYAPVSGYPSSGYPATAGRPGIPSEAYSYADQPGDYPSQGQPYRQPGPYPGGAQARGDPRSASGYPYVSSPPDVSMHGAPIDDRYDSYVQTMPQTSSSRAYVGSRGTPVYDPPPPHPRDGYNIREPIREERRRR